MSYVKKNFDGDYLKWYQTISSNSSNSVQDIENYSHVSGTIKSLKWEGSGKVAVCSKIDQIDNVCDNYYQSVSCMVNKTKITYNILYKELALLKEKIALYNQCVDDYDSLNSQLTRALLDEK